MVGQVDMHRYDLNGGTQVIISPQAVDFNQTRHACRPEPRGPHQEVEFLIGLDRLFKKDFCLGDMAFERLVAP
jgi:hypothetical protein